MPVQIATRVGKVVRGTGKVIGDGLGEGVSQFDRFLGWFGGGKEEEEAAAASAAKENEERIQSLLQEFSVLLEYERLPELLPSGMYVMPSYETVLTWNGTIFARHGLYRGGVFKFQMELPDDYPDSPPKVRFLTDVFHPLVERLTGRVDIFAFFPEWRAGRDYASCVLPHLHRALLRREYVTGSARPALNPEAKELFVSDPAAFAAKAAECASLSMRKVYDNTPGTSMQFTKGPVEAHERILTKLRENPSHAAFEDRKNGFVDWFCDHYSKQRTHVGHATEVETRFFEKDAKVDHYDSSRSETAPEEDQESSTSHAHENKAPGKEDQF